MRRDKYCTLIIFCPRDSQATYFDSGSDDKKKDYTNFKMVLDDALEGYFLKGGLFAKGREKFNKEGKHVFTHVTTFPCVKQPPGSQKEAFYAIHHMRGFIRDQTNLTLPSNLRKWAEQRDRILDQDLREDFFRIQTQLAEYIHYDVVTKGGKFFYGTMMPPKRAIEDRLLMQCDFRDFMTKGGVAPLPEPSRKS